MAFDDDQKRTEFVGRTNTVGFVNAAFFLIGFICFIVAYTTFAGVGNLTVIYLVFAAMYGSACGLAFFIAARVKKLELGKPLKSDRSIDKAHQYFVVVGHKSILITSIIGLILCIATLLFGRMWTSFKNEVLNNGTANALDDKLDYYAFNSTTPGYDPEDEAVEIHSLYIFIFIYCILNIAVVLGVNNFFFLNHIDPLMKVPVPVVTAGNITQTGGVVNQPMINVQPASTVQQPQVVVTGKPQTTVAGGPSPAYQQPAVQYVPPQQQPGTYYPVQQGAQPGTFYPVQQGVAYYPMQPVQQPAMYVQPPVQGQPPSYQPSSVVPPIQYNNDQPNAPPPKTESDP